MPKDGDEINKVALRPIWKKAKDDAETLAAKSPADKKEYAALVKTGFKGDLGPDLDKWFKDWPDYKKISAAKEALDITIVKYENAVKKSSLSKPVALILTKALGQISTELDKRLLAASTSIASDMDRGVKESLESHNNKKLVPIVLFYKANIAKAVLAKATVASKKLEVEEIEIEIILDDKKVLQNFPDDDLNLPQKMYDAADRDLIIQQIAKALDEISKDVNTEADLPKAQKAFDEAVEKAIEAATDRVSEEVKKLADLRVERRNYKIGKAVKIGSLIVGIGAGITTLATAPFTAGASAVIGILALMNQAKTLFDECVSLARSAEQAADALAGDIKTMLDTYQSKNREAEAGNLEIGLSEMGGALVNSIWPGFTATISDSKKQSETLKIKVGGIVTHAHDVSVKIGDALKEQQTAKQKMDEFHKAAEKAGLEKGDMDKIEKLLNALEKNYAQVHKLIEETIALNKRAEIAGTKHKILDQVLTALAAKQPAWSVFGEAVIKVSTAVGFLVGGNVNVPDAFKIYDTVNKAMTGIGDGISSAQALVDLKDSAEDMLKQRAKKK